MNIRAELRRRVASALVEVTGDKDAASLADMVLPSQDAKHGDYQANCAMPLGKKLGKPPREIAAAIVEQLNLNVDGLELCELPTIAGPGFINLKLTPEALASLLQQAGSDDQRLGVPPVAAPRTYVLDYSAPNVAKPMHVGHVRSTVIGAALYKTLKFLGHRVISDNHIGDWGTQFGMIITGWRIDGSEERYAVDPVRELTDMYRLANMLSVYHGSSPEGLAKTSAAIDTYEAKLADSRAEAPPRDPKAAKEKEQLERQLERKIAEVKEERDQRQAVRDTVDSNPHWKSLADKNPNVADQVLAETAKLHHGDAENLALWNRFLPACREELEKTYTRLKVTFDHTLGESFYEEALPGVVEDLTKRGLATESQGAICIFLKGFEAPFIVQKQDGAFLYATTDLATIQYRMSEWKPDAILYVVDHRQSDHFKQLFATARLWGYTEDKIELQHVSFGTVLGDDGKPFKTRSGSSVGLMGLLDEAVERAHAIAAQSEVLASATEEERRTVAERIGIGAIKYADLAHNRTSDYKFSYDKMLAMTGNTAAYMQYSYARVSSIFAKGDVDPHRLRLDEFPITLESPFERALAVALLQFPEALDRVVADYRPNNLTDYLFDLASKYAAFFENCPVLKAESEELRTSRLKLCDLTARILKQGLNLLGIETVERM
jgi:arginyl-tRNA synthetase